MPIFGPKICIFLRYAHITPIFWGQMDPNQWDHKSPISWGNSGYLRYSGMWPFGRSAGRFTAPIAQSGLFWGQKCCFSAGNSFFRDIIQNNCSHCDRTPKRQQFCVDSLHGGPLGGRQGPFLAQNWPQKQSFFMLHPVAPIFGAQTDYTLWDHNFPISWGNFGYLRFSGRCPFGCSAGCFRALIA